MTGKPIDDQLGSIEEAQAGLRASIERSKALADQTERLVSQCRSGGDLRSDCELPNGPERQTAPTRAASGTESSAAKPK